MVTKLSIIGADLGVIIEKALLDRLAIDEETPLEVQTDGEALIIRPVASTHRERLLELADELMDHHDETFRKLAK